MCNPISCDFHLFHSTGGDDRRLSDISGDSSSGHGTVTDRSDYTGNCTGSVSSSDDGRSVTGRSDSSDRDTGSDGASNGFESGRSDTVSSSSSSNDSGVCWSGHGRVRQSVDS